MFSYVAWPRNLCVGQVIQGLVTALIKKKTKQKTNENRVQQGKGNVQRTQPSIQSKRKAHKKYRNKTEKGHGVAKGERHVTTEIIRTKRGL
jgi:hypothetical protein